MNLQNVLLIASGGAFGAILRSYLGLLISKNTTSFLPLGTLFVNCTGCFLIGILYVFLDQFISQNIRSLLITGFLGAFTTYSAFALESVLLLEKNFSLGFLNIILNALGSVLFAFLGIKIAQFFS